MLTADEVLAAVRVHADRVHDAVRRLGCGPDAAVEVVEHSAIDLVDAAAGEPLAVGDPVGWWFARARALGRSLAGGDDDLPVGGGVLGGDANQVRLAEALESRPERERAALLLRDSYDLPAGAVGTALGLDAAHAMEVVGAARLAFLPALLGGTAPSLTDHVVDLGALARLAEGGQFAARDATTRRHVQSCDRCAAVVDAQERARRLLSGLTVVALPDAEREALLARVEGRARAVLPEAEPEPEEWDDEPHRRYSLSLMALGVVLAGGLGLGVGLLVSRGSPVSAVAVTASPLPLVTAAPVFSLPPIATAGASGSPALSPSPRVFLITPSPTAAPSASATASPTPTVSTEPLALELNPSSGPNDSDITVNGRGWTPGATVTLQYLERFRQSSGSTASAIVDERGRFTTTLTAHDGQDLPGPHDVVADDGTQRAQTTFTATG
ncbi:MAG: Neocarzinostatin family [Frankiales bacterium]|nr:Neocarzinostatin family [Frankiales bacterium]